MLFSEGAGRLAGLAGALLGWRPDEFWRATPAELAGVVRAMIGEGEAALSAGDIERLRAMFPDDSSSGCDLAGRKSDGGGSASARAEGPLHHAAHGPPPRSGEDLNDG